MMWELEYAYYNSSGEWENRNEWFDNSEDAYRHSSNLMSISDQYNGCRVTLHAGLSKVPLHECRACGSVAPSARNCRHCGSANTYPATSRIEEASAMSTDPKSLIEGQLFKLIGDVGRCETEAQTLRITHAVMAYMGVISWKQAELKS
jgi:hypothetical protein